MRPVVANDRDAPIAGDRRRSEGRDDALEATDHYFDIILREHSFVVTDGRDDDAPDAFSFVMVIDEVHDVHDVDPVVVAP